MAEKRISQFFYLTVLSALKVLIITILAKNKRAVKDQLEVRPISMILSFKEQASTPECAAKAYGKFQGVKAE